VPEAVTRGSELVGSYAETAVGQFDIESTRSGLGAGIPVATTIKALCLDAIVQATRTTWPQTAASL